MNIRLLARRASLVVLPIALPLSGCGGGSSSSTQSSTLPVCQAAPSSKMVQADSALPASSRAQARGGFRALKGHVLRWTAESTDQGRIDGSTVLPITVSLELANPDELASELAAIYQPGNPKYRHFLTPAEFRTRFTPSDSQIASVKSYLESQGLQSVSVDENRLLVRAIGKASDVQAAFGTEIHNYSHPSGRKFSAPANELAIPANLPIQGVHGLQNLTLAHNHAHPRQASANPIAATGPSGGFSPKDIRTAYHVPTNVDGSGQTLALFELDGYNTSDINQYTSNFGIPTASLQNVLVDGASGGAGGGAAEVTLDIELMLAVAPKAAKIYVYEGPNSDTGILDTYAKIANDNLGKAVSSSWGQSEDQTTSSLIQAENTVFMQMAAQGQTIYSAAGDAGAYDNGSTLSIDDPSGQPYMVAVGGTTLTTDSSGAISKETTWTDGGGGISSVWSIPAWQQGLSTSANKASQTMRNIPDVSLNADMNTGYSIYTGGSWGVWGGTSCSAPLWAGFTALVNQARAGNGQGPIGYILPTLYALGKSGRASSDFFDIADGSTNRYYPAVAGYDDATGWGSFNATNLLADLSGAPVSGGSGSNPGPVNSCAAP